MLRKHVLVLSVLPLVLNVLITPLVITSAVSLPEFLERPTYYIYTFGFFLWSVYHILLASLALRFFKTEKESVRGVIGPVRDKLWLTVLLTAALIGLSILIFQLIEPQVIDLVYGSGAWRQMLKEFKGVSLVVVIYGLAATSLTAGICEELVWRGYLQTRFGRLLRGRIRVAISLQALLFGFWHSTSVHTLFTAAFGLVYGYVYAKTKRLLPLMVSHWLGDAIGFSTMYFI